MNWRFTIIDRDNISHEIQEPVGWDAIEIDILRDENTHGIIFDYQGKDMKYYGDAMRLLRTEYETYGSQGNMVLVIEQSCNEVLTELYRGKFLFLQYDYSSGTECFVKIPIENTGDVIDLTTKWDQKVDLSTTVAFDGVTALDSYSKLGFDLTLPSKGIIIEDRSIKNVETVESVSFSPSEYWGTIEFALDDKFSEIGNYSFNATTVISDTIASFSTENPDSIRLPNAPSGQISQGLFYTSLPEFPQYKVFSDTEMNTEKWFNPSILSPAINYQQGTTNYEVDIQAGTLAYKIDCEIKVLEDSDYVRLSRSNLYLAKKDINGTISFINVQHIYDKMIGSDDGVGIGELTNYVFKIDISLSYSNNTFVLNKGDEIFLFMSVAFDGLIPPNTNLHFKITTKPTSFFSFKTLSKTQPSNTKAFLINEVISRISETITNNKIKAYSDYFGRTDSQPYAVSSNGIGSMEALAKGIYIRNQQNRIVGQPNVFSLSMKDVFEGIEPIHHIGFGIENDPNREGFKRLRVEHWKHFYTNDTIMECIGVNNIQRKMVESKSYSTFQFGYDKYEAEQYNGLDEFLTKRTFRTTLNGIKSELVKVSKFIASGYAWEITRRKNTDSSDWRFDNDTFIVCCKNGIILSGEYAISITFSIVGGYNFIEIHIGYGFGFHVGLQIGDSVHVYGSSVNTGEFIITEIISDGNTFIYGTGTTIKVKVLQAVSAEVLTNKNWEIKGIIVETGNVDTPTNMVDPDTTYNFRISPIRNAMRWMDKISQGYKSNPTIIFTDGTGNYFASGKMTDSVGRLENAVIAENQTLLTSLFTNTDNASPLLAPELLTFDFPMSIAQFRNVLNNPYGQIHWSNGFDSGYGYISSLKYKPEDGVANFSLIPKI